MTRRQKPETTDGTVQLQLHLDWTGPYSTSAEKFSEGPPSGSASMPSAAFLRQVIVKSQAQETGSDQTSLTNAEPIADKFYPHLYEAEATSSGAAMLYLDQALQLAQRAAKEVAEADLATLSSRVGLIAASLAAAHKWTAFNEDLGAVVSYVRRAALRAIPSELTLEQLMGLVRALRTLKSQPMLDLDRAAELVEGLRTLGWDGEHREVAAFLAELLGRPMENDEEPIATVLPSESR